MTVSRETKLAMYSELLVRWSGALNLSSKSESHFAGFQAHINDSLSLLDYLPHATDRLIDLGSGQGFPAIPLAIMADIQVDLIEADRRKAAFLTTVLAKLELRGSVFRSRFAETVIAPSCCVTARAVAPIKLLLEMATPFLEPGGYGLFLKGQQAAAELREAVYAGRFSVSIHPTSPKSNLVKVRKLV